MNNRLCLISKRQKDKAGIRQEGKAATRQEKDNEKNVREIKRRDRAGRGEGERTGGEEAEPRPGKNKWIIRGQGRTDNQGDRAGRTIRGTGQDGQSGGQGREKRRE